MQTLISQNFFGIKHEKFTDARDPNPADFLLFRRSKQRGGLGEGCENNSQLPHPFALDRGLVKKKPKKSQILPLSQILRQKCDATTGLGK